MLSSGECTESDSETDVIPNNKWQSNYKIHGNKRKYTPQMQASPHINEQEKGENFYKKQKIDNSLINTEDIEEGECTSSSDISLNVNVHYSNTRIGNNHKKTKKNFKKKRKQFRKNTQKKEKNFNKRGGYCLQYLLPSNIIYSKLVYNLLYDTPVQNKYTNFQFKIKDLQFILVQLLARINRDMNKSYRNKHSLTSVVFIWLASVSSEHIKNNWGVFNVLFSRETSHSLHYINPGTNNFVKPGYEEILLIPKLENFSTTSNSTSGDNSTVVSYILKPEDIKVNGYPLKETHPNFLKLGNAEIRDSLLDDILVMLAVDCEFCDSSTGKVLTRVSIVDEKLNCIYDTFVKPQEEITDYKTKFSGITEEILRDVTTTLEDVQKYLKNTLTDTTVLVGHSLENDLIVLKINYPYVIDTSLLFTPTATPNFKPSLKFLVQKVLNIDMRVNSDAHNSIEDATCCMKLIQAKINLGPSYTISWNDDKISLVEYIAYCGYKSLLVDLQASIGRHSHHSKVKCSYSLSDDARIQTLLDSFSDSECNYDFIWTQLHDFRIFLKDDNQEHLKGENNKSKIQLELINLIRKVEMIYQAARPGTMLMVCAGSGNLQKMKAIQENGNFKKEDLREAVAKAKQGVVFFKLKPFEQNFSIEV